MPDHMLLQLYASMITIYNNNDQYN